MTAQQVRRRSPQPPPERPRVWLAVLGVLVVVIAGGAVVLLVHGTRDSSVDDAAAPASPGASTSPQKQSPDTEPSPTTPAAAGQDVAAPVYFVGPAARGSRLFREFQPLQGVTAAEELQRATQSAVSGAALDPDYTSAWPGGTTATITSSSANGVTVDLRGSDSALTAAPAGGNGALGLQSVVYTVDAVLGRPAPVTFTLDGRAVPTVLGVDASAPVQRADPLSVQAPVWVTSPADGASVGSTFTVRGVAATFEANVEWELKDGSRVVRQGHATAKECCTPSPYEFTVPGVPTGSYTLVVHDSDDSGEGAKVNQDTKAIRVQ